MNNKSFGSAGEQLAAKYLEDKSYEILEQNYANKIGEIDIIAKQNDTIVFVEVKTRTSSKFGLPREAVTRHKQYKIRLVALAYLKSKKLMNSKCRFDVIEELDGKLTHIENCF
ncbi:MAG: YraN family protein [Clostridia bacterium]|nr:YraN family protein [Clostridia bacterium]